MSEREYFHVHICVGNTTKTATLGSPKRVPLNTLGSVVEKRIKGYDPDSGDYYILYPLGTGRLDLVDAQPVEEGGVQWLPNQ